MPRSDRHRLRPVGFLRAARSRHRGDLDPRLPRRAHGRTDVFGANDRERAEPAAHRGASRGVHGFLRPFESRRHLRTRKELSAMSTIETGKKAPLFTLPGTGGEWSLKDALGRPVVMYFYPRDNTPGCTQEGESFTSHFAGFKKAKTLIFGISADS